MSELQPLRVAEAHRSVQFRPLWQSDAEPALCAEPVAQDEAPDLFAMGYRQGLAEAEQAFADDRTRFGALLAACEALQPESSEEFGLLIAEVVERLVRQIVGEVAVDTELLLERASRAAAFVAEADAARTIHLHPDDLALVDCSRLAIAAVADPDLSRGCVRIEDSTGWLEYGIATHLDALREQLGIAGATR